MNQSIRLQKFLSEQGICSRRQAEDLIKKGLVLVNQKPAKLGDKIDPDSDKVRVKGTSVKNKENKKVYIILNKPTGYISSSSGRQGKSVMSLLTAKNYTGEGRAPKLPRLVIVGRLDKDSEGLVLLTNDNAMVNELTHPRYAHEKEYEVTLAEPLKAKDKKIMEHGMKVGPEIYQGVKFTKVNKNVVRLILREGKNRQIRKMFGALGYNLVNLKRIRISNIKLGGLPVGRWNKIERLKGLKDYCL